MSTSFVDWVGRDVLSHQVSIVEAMVSLIKQRFSLSLTSVLFGFRLIW